VRIQDSLGVEIYDIVTAGCGVAGDSQDPSYPSSLQFASFLIALWEIEGENIEPTR
jgi:hypothetical protein